MKDLISVTAYFVFCTIALAAYGADLQNVDWKYYTTDKEESLYYYNPKPWEHRNIFRVWVKAKHSDKVPELKESTILWEINCSNNYVRRIIATLEKKDGSVSKISSPTEWTAIHSGSAEEALSGILCVKKKQKKQ